MIRVTKIEYGEYNPFMLRDFLTHHINNQYGKWLGIVDINRILKILKIGNENNIYIHPNWTMRKSHIGKDCGLYFVSGINYGTESILALDDENIDWFSYSTRGKCIIHIPDINYSKGSFIILEDVFLATMNNINSVFDKDGNIITKEQSNKEKSWINCLKKRTMNTVN